MTQRRILHLINTAGPGGAETVFLRLVTGLDRSRWESIPFVPEVDWLTHELRNAGADPHIDRARSRFDLGFFRRLSGFLRRERIDVIHSHLFGPTVEAGILSRITSVPTIGTIHGVGDLSPRESLKALKFGLVRQGVARLVFVSDSLRDSFLSRGNFPRARTEVIANGVDPAAHMLTRDAAVREELGIPEDAFVVGAVGNLRPVKRYDLFLQMAALLHSRDPNYRFVVVGQDSEPLHGELLSLRSSLGLEGIVHFTGFRGDVERILPSLDLFTITSDSEGFSIATVQAMASGLPVVATRCGGPEEILEDGITGRLAPTGDVAAMAEVVEALRRNPQQRASLAAAGRRSAARRFSSDAQIARYEALYEAVIAERGGDRRSDAPNEPVGAATT